MKIVKVFNNNSVAALSSELGDIILTGSGIGFKKKIGDNVDESKVEKTYLFKDSHNDYHKQMFDSIPSVYFRIANKIVERANCLLKVNYSGEIFMAISDHLSFAIKRKKEGEYVPNIILNETRILYKRQYEIGLWALDYIEKILNVRLDEDDAGYIALYLVNFSLDNETNNIQKIIVLTKEILNILNLELGDSISLNEIGYARITTHLKFLGERIFRNENNFNDTTANIRDILKEDKQLSICINKIVDLIYNRYDYKLSPDEQTYLCLNIKRIMVR